MKKVTLAGLLLVSAMAVPGFASLSTVQSGPSVRTISDLKLSDSKLRESNPSAAVDSSSKLRRDLLLSFNKPLPAKGNLLATTELKINLDNFDMEYVLKVQ
jgi:hypothetical protein